MGLKVFKPMYKPMFDQPVDIDLFDSIYNSINSLNVSDIDFVVDNFAEPWRNNQGAGDVVSAKSSSGLQLKIVAGIVAAHDGTRHKRAGRRHWVVSFPASASFTSNPIVVATAVYNGPEAEPVATTIQWTSTKQFKIFAQAIDDSKIKISHWNYLAAGV